MIILDQCHVPASLLAPDDVKRLGGPISKVDPLVPVQIRIEGGKITGILSAGAAAAPGATVENLGGAVVSPRFLDAHTHLDKAHTWFRAPNKSGTFGEAIEVLGQDKQHWTEEDVYARADYALRCAYAYGTTALRTHIDTGLPWAERSYKAMEQLRRAWSGRVELQTVSLAGVDAYAGPDGAALADLPLRYGSSAIGGMPVMNPELDTQLDALLRLAKERQTDVDLHVDESGDTGALTLLAVAEAVIRNDFPGKVVCGHACSLAVQEPALQAKVLHRVKEAGIAIISLPLCNLYLQDRRDAGQTPYWRGITLINEFMDQGTPTACASDNIRDAFYAYGDLDMFEVLIASIRIAHLDNQLSRSPLVATRGPAEIMRLRDYGYLAEGLPARFIAFESRTFSEWLSRPCQGRRLFERDGWICPGLPSYAELPLNAG